MIQAFGVADIVDRHVVVLTPEVRHRGEFLPAPEHIERGSLALTLGDDPMLHPNVIAAVGIWPADNVARGQDPRRGSFKVLVDHNAAVELETSPVSKLGSRPHA